MMNKDTPYWRLSTCVIFRFFCLYLILYNASYAPLWQAVVPWVGSHILHLKSAITTFTNGSGDTTYDYVLVLCYFVLATTGTIIWSIKDRYRSNYCKLHEWLRLLVRLVLAGAMISYGMAKVLPLQFGLPSLERLVTPFGETSPMGLLWRFMAASRAFTIIAGLLEVIAGLMLIVPRLTTIASMMCIGIMGHVFMLNLCYDVPVKLFSFHLLFMSFFLLAPDLPRLANVFLFQTQVEPPPARQLFKFKWLNQTAFFLQLSIGLVFVLQSFHACNTMIIMQPGVDSESPLYGVWTADTFLINDVIQPPLLTDATRWHRVIFDAPHTLCIQKMTGAWDYYNLHLEE